MRTPDYGKITEFKNQAGHGGINIPIHFTEKDRWICHRFASPQMGNGNWGSEIIVLVDNFGETYHFSEQDSGNGYTMTLTSYNKDMSVRSGNYRIYDGCSCISTEIRSIAFTDSFIDILKATPRIGLDSRKEIDNYINILRRTNYWEEDNKKGKVHYTEDEDCCPTGYINIYMYNFKENESTKYKGYEAYGSWDNWDKPCEIISWDFKYYGNTKWIIELPEKYVKLGKKYLYKLKKDGAWIEPTEDELRIKDENGNWNNVIFIH
jgi:hypothetical protein